MARHPELQDADWLRARVEEGLTYEQIAERVSFDCSREAVRRALVRHGIRGAFRPGQHRAEVSW